MKYITREEFSQLLSTFSIRPKLKRELRYVPEEIDHWESRDFLAVTDRNRMLGVMIVSFDRLQVAPFRLSKRTSNSSGRVEAIICDICATWRRGVESAVITFEKHTGGISFLVCDDLKCSLHVRVDTPAAVLSRVQLRETMTSEARVERLQTRLRNILNEI